MPCRDYGYEEEEAERRATQRVETKAKLDRLTRLLCTACGILYNSSVLVPVSDETKDLARWFAEHQLLDEQHKQKETENGRS